MAEKRESWSGLTDQEAEEFHKYYLQGTTLFVLVALAAHALVWMWRPWIPPAGGYKAALIDGATSVAPALMSLLS